MSQHRILKAIARSKVRQRLILGATIVITWIAIMSVLYRFASLATNATTAQEKNQPNAITRLELPNSATETRIAYEGAMNTVQTFFDVWTQPTRSAETQRRLAATVNARVYAQLPTLTKPSDPPACHLNILDPPLIHLQCPDHAYLVTTDGALVIDIQQQR